jgi:hypothetical protein
MRTRRLLVGVGRGGRGIGGRDCIPCILVVEGSRGMWVVVSRGVVVGFGGVVAGVVGSGMLFGRLRRRSMYLGRTVVLFERNLIDGVTSPVSSTNLPNR